MSAEFIGSGNMAAVPELKYVPVRGEQKPVCELRVYFDRMVPDGDNGFREEGGFFMTASIWGPRAEHLHKHLTKRSRVRVEGTLKMTTWKDSVTDEDRSKLVIDADHVSLCMTRIKGVEYTEKKVEANAA